MVHLPGSLTKLPACHVESTIAILKVCCIAANLMHAAYKNEARLKERLEKLGLWGLLLETSAAMITYVDLDCLRDFTEECAPFEAYLPTEGTHYMTGKMVLVRDLIAMRKAACLCYRFYLGEAGTRSEETAGDIARSLRLCLFKETDIWEHVIVGLAECVAAFSGLYKILVTMMKEHPTCTPRLANCTNAAGRLLPMLHPRLRKKLAGSLLKEFRMVIGLQPSCYYDEDAVVLYPSHPGSDLYYLPQCLYYVYNLRTRCLGPMPCHIESAREFVVNNFKSMAAYAAKTEAKSCIYNYGWCCYSMPGCDEVCEQHIVPKYVKSYGAPRRDDDVDKYHKVAQLQYE